MEQGQENRSARGRGRPFQFGLRTLLVMVTVVALVCVVYFVLPDAISGGVLILMHALTATVLFAAAIYARGNLQAFCVGALVPVIGPWFVLFPLYFLGNWGETTAQDAMGDVLYSLEEIAMPLKLTMASTWGLSLFCGLASLLVARGLQRQRHGGLNDERDDEPG